MNIVAIALFIIMAVILIKFKIVCEVTANGEKLGYITDKEKFEQSVSGIINKKEDNMHLNYTKDVMELMTKFRETWNLKYPEEE